jgi:hypothetical protein
VANLTYCFGVVMQELNMMEVESVSGGDVGDHSDYNYVGTPPDMGNGWNCDYVEGGGGRIHCVIPKRMIP